MSTKDLFNKNNKTLTKSQADKAKKDLESDELAAEVVKSNTRFLSHINYSKPGNFAIYGSAEKYYEDSFDRVYKTYPYDGSHKEKQEWLNDSSELDLWVLNNAYPKSVGHVRLGTGQSIFVKGGPNNQPGVEETDPEELSKQFPVKQGNSNIWNPSVYRNSNLHLDPNLGFTVEFWMKFDDPELPNTTPFVIGNISGKKVEIRSLGNNSGMLTIIVYDDAFTGGTQFNAMAMHNFFESTWNHYSFSFINSDDKVKTEIYKNGVLRADFLNGTTIGAISQEELYLNINGSMSSVTGGRSNVIDGMYIDEFRFWKQKRTAEETGRYWNTNIHGGTNTDDDKYSEENRNVDIGIYYKFNEGITGDDTIDATVLDYSGRISNGTIINYSNTVRSTTSALDEYGQFILPEEKDYIIYSQHPEFVSSREEYKRKGLVHDLSNNSSIYHTMPAWIAEEDEQKGSNIKELSQVISSYFDNAHIQIRELTNLREKEYYSLDNETEKPFYIIRNSLESQGMVVPDLFTEASAFEEILSRSETALFEEKLQDVKNTIYQNIYNNLSYIYKSKGTEKAFRNLIRCFGIDDELVKINMYSDGADYTLEDTRRPVAIKKKFVDFNHPDRTTAVVYTKADSSNSDSQSYIKGASKKYPANLSFTFETQAIFPKSIPKDHPKYEPPSNSEEHIALLGEYISYSNANQNSIFNLKAVKKGNFNEAEDVKFELNFNGTTISTKLFKSVYDNAKFNLAVRLVPNDKLSTLVGNTAASPDYTAELYCVRMLGGTIEDEDFQTLAVSNADARAILEMDKFVSVGALKTNNNPEYSTTTTQTRIKIGSTLFWYDNVTNEEIRAHASDASNFGRLHPSEEAYMFDEQFNTDSSSAIQVSRRDTLAMHWDFSEVTTSDNNGEFIVNDLSESLEKVETSVSQNSIQFTGANGETIDIPDSDSLSFTDGNGTDKSFTISSWVKVDNPVTFGDSGVIISRRNSVGVGIEDGEWIIGHSYGSIYVILYADPIQNGIGAFSTVNRIYFQASSADSLSSNTWHQITVTYDGTKDKTGLKVYKDGVELNPVTLTKNNYNGMPNFNLVTTIGGTDSPTTNTFEDNIADTSVFNKALSSDEVVELYNDGTVKDLEEFSAYDKIISWWKMGDDQDAIGAGGIKDYVGTNNGTLVGASIQPAPDLPSDIRVDSGRFGWFTGLVGYEVTGLGKHFFPDDNQVVNREFVYSQKHRTPEVINSEDLVEIRTQDDEIFTKDATVTSHFFAIEKSMYQVISDDMINLFATIVEFNDLIGQPVNRYRLQYKALEKFRARYFEKVKNVPSLEKYTELYKWIDSSIGIMLQELIPVSSNFSADLRNMVESHVLERNKYWTKFPTMEMSGEPPLGIVKGVNELTYNWEHGHFSRKEPEYFASFNGTTSNIEVPDAPNLSFDESMSISMWFRFADLSQGQITMLYKVGEYYINIDPQPTGNLSAFYFGVKPQNGGNDLYINFGKDIEADRWYNLVMTYDGGLDENSVECYIDGHSVPSNTVDSITVPMSDTAGVLKIGSGNGGLFSEVDLSDVALYEKRLTQDEAVGLYNNQRPSEIIKSPNVSALVSLWRLDGDSKDSKGDNNGAATDVTFGENITEEKTFLWSDKRGTIAKTDISEVDNNREILRRVATRKTQGNTKVVERNGVDVEEDKPVLREPPTAPNTPGAVYSGQAYVTRALSRPYRLNLDVVKTIHGGTNYSPSTKDPNSFVRAVTKFIPGAGTVGIDVDVADNPVTYEQWKELYTVKRSITVTIADTEANITQNFDDDVFYPYYGEDFRDASPFITGHHNDSYGEDAEIPVQGPFTETWVGGNQHRHVDFVKQTDRPELYLDDSGTLKHPYELSPNNPAARYTRDEVAKRPVNVRNIKTKRTPQTSFYDFENIAIGQVPFGWTVFGSGDVQQNSTGTNKAFSFHGPTVLTVPAQEKPELGNQTYYRGVTINEPFVGPITVSFRAYEGVDTSGEYLADNKAETNNNLYLQYSTDGSSWTSAAELQPASQVWDFSQLVTAEIPAKGDVYLRWAMTTETNGDYDNWAIDDITIIEHLSLKGSDFDRLQGNYTRDYEVVQTSSRSKNNRYFVRNEGITDTLTVAPIQDAQDFTLPDRGRTEHVIVERFSAPGDPLTLSRGYLDRIAEEFSVYNSVNYRNLDDRQANTADLSAHSALYEGSQGYMPDTNGMPNIHKVNRNTSHEARGKNHDNAFISYQIPRSDFQYNVEMISTEYPERKDYDDIWVRYGITPSDPPTAPAGYTYNHSGSGSGPDYAYPLEAIHSKAIISFDVEIDSVVADETLYYQYKLGEDGTWTTLKSFLYNGGDVHYSEEIDLGQSVHNPLYIRWISTENPTGGGATGRFYVRNICYKPTSFEKYVEEATVIKGLNDYADYQGAGYRFIKNGEKPQVLRNRRNNIVSQINRTRSEIAPRTTTDYVEPVVTWNKPNTHFVLNERYDEIVRSEPSEAAGVNESPRGLLTRENNIIINSNPITYSYSNNLETFSNVELANVVDVFAERRGQFIDSLMEVFKSGDLLFHRSIAREIIYPRHRNVGLKKTRFRNEFDNYKFFWKDEMFERIKCSDTTKLDYKITPEFDFLFGQKYSVDVMDSFYYTDGSGFATFNGADAVVTIPDDSSLSFTSGGFSLSLWINMTQATSTEDTILFKVGEYYLNITPTGMRVGIKDSNGTQLANAPSPLNDNALVTYYEYAFNLDEWYHIAVSYDGGLDQEATSLYINGYNIASYTTDNITSQMDDTAGVLYIGAGGNSGTQFHFDGKIQDVVLIGREMTVEEVRELCQENNVASFSGYDDIVSHWNLYADGNDSVGSNNATATDNVVFTQSDPIRVIGDLTYIGEDRMRHLVTKKSETPLHVTNIARSTKSGLEGLCETSQSYPDIVPNYSTKIADSAPIPSPQLYYNAYHELSKESDGWINRKTNLKPNPKTGFVIPKPAYNDYDSYSEDIRLVAPNYGLVSEFRISEHMDKYILEHGGNFRAKNYDFLTLDGASYDGSNLTLSSGDMVAETTSFYSTIREDDSAEIQSYPSAHPSSNESTLIKNNANGFYEFNTIHSPNYSSKFTSTFALENSINTGIEITASKKANRTSILPAIDGENAAGKFNLNQGDTDYLLVSLNQSEPDADTSNRITYKDPLTISIWAQPVDTNEDYQMIMADTNMNSQSGFDQNFVLYSKFKLPNSASGYENLGLTLVISDDITDIGSPSSGIFTFFKKNGDKAKLDIDHFNHIALQFMPPNTKDTNVSPENTPYLAKLWLNGEELYGVFVQEFLNEIIPVSVSSGKYRVNGVTQGDLNLIRGRTYIFDTTDNSNSTHAFALSDTSDGTHGGGAKYTSGWNDDVANELVFKVPSNAPDTLYYYCESHSGMGGQVNISSVQIRGYSPCQIGLIQGNPWTGEYNSGMILDFNTDYEFNYRIGIDSANSSTDYNFQALSLGMITHNFEGLSSTHKFNGLLDELCVFKGLVGKNSIENIYNEGKPNNVNELIANDLISNNFLYNTELTFPPLFGIPGRTVPVTLDNGEFDFGYNSKYALASDGGFILKEDFNDFTGVNNGVAQTTSDFLGPNWSLSANATIFPSQFGANNSVLSIIGNDVAANAIVDPPYNSGFYREQKYSIPQNKRAKEMLLQFRVYEGRDNAADGSILGDYGLNNKPEYNSNQESSDNLYVQYSTDNGNTYTTIQVIEPGNGSSANQPYWDLSQLVTNVVSDASDITTIRFLSKNTDSDNANDFDHWGLDDILLLNIEDNQTELLEGKSIIISGSGAELPPAPFFNFSENYTESYQLQQRTVLPVWHRIGIPKYDKVTVSGNWDKEFFDSYVHTDNIEFIEKSNDEHNSLGIDSTERVSLRVNAIKKLLPYEGFYPQDRTVQIAKLFTEKLDPAIMYDESLYKEQAVQAALQHFFAPGILYNSIKSGVACDWASYTNDSGLEPIYAGQSVVTYSDTGAVGIRYLKDPAPYWFRVCQEAQAYTDGADDFERTQETELTESELFAQANVHLWGHSKYEEDKFAVFTGSQNGNIQVADDPSLSFTSGPMSISMAVKFDNINTHPLKTALYKVGEYFININPQPEGMDSLFYFGLYDQDGAGDSMTVAWAEPMQNKEWYYLNFTYDGTLDQDAFELYINGRKIQTNTTATLATSMDDTFSTLFIGSGNNALYLTAHMKDVAIYEKVLTQEEVTGLYNGEIEHLSIPELVSLWKLDEITTDSSNNNIVLDSKGTNNGTVSATGVSIANYPWKVDGLVLTKEPNRRLPFEAILDPFSFLTSGRNEEEYEIDTGINIRRKSNQHYLITPDYYKDMLTTFFGSASDNYKKYSYPYFEINTKAKSKDFRYELAINNFLAESVKFFIKEERLTTFSSKPESEFLTMEQGRTYYMDVTMKKSDNFSIVNSRDSLGGKYFGPPSAYLKEKPSRNALYPYGGSPDSIKDPAYAPYTPPYFYGESVARISFTPTSSKKYSLQEIFAGADITYKNDEARDYFISTNLQVTGVSADGTETAENPYGPSDPYDGDFNQSVAWKAKMPLSASVELLGKTRLPQQEFEPSGLPRGISTSASDSDVWIIYSKFECPLFNFNKEINSSSEGALEFFNLSQDVKETKANYSASLLRNRTGLDNAAIDARTGSGIWAGYGQQNDDTGVTISLRESFPVNAPIANTIPGSLIQVCGFQTESKPIGTLADEKEISEAVLMIPYVEKPIRSFSNVDGVTKVTTETIQVDDRNFIRVDADEYREQVRKYVRGDVIYTTKLGRELKQTSMTNMVQGLLDYNVPPLYNFDRYSQDPFVMYFFEFKHTLDKEDLGNIWQGVLPKIGKEASLDSVQVSHEINRHEFFGNLGSIPKNVKWMVFKVKKKGEKNYSRVTEDSRDDRRFRFEFDVGTKAPEYGYNYPYDYFTMLEMIQVEAHSEKKIDPHQQLDKAKEREE